MLPVRLLFVAGILLALAVSVSSSSGQGKASSAQADLDVLVRRAQIIARGQVISARIEPHPQFRNLQTLVITFGVTRLLKGEIGSTYTFRQFLLDSSDTDVLAAYKSAGELLLFLNPASQYGLTSTVGLEQGRFRIFTDSQGNRLALNGRGNVGLFDQLPRKASARGFSLSPKALDMMSKPGGPAPLDTLEATIQLLAGAGT